MGNGSKCGRILDCVKSRREPYSPIDLAIRIQASLSMAVLAHRQSKVARFDKPKLAIVL